MMEGSSKYLWLFLIVPAFILIVLNLIAGVARWLNR